MQFRKKLKFNSKKFNVKTTLNSIGSESDFSLLLQLPSVLMPQCPAYHFQEQHQLSEQRFQAKVQRPLRGY
jgi:hypothetical protein